MLDRIPSFLKNKWNSKRQYESSDFKNRCLQPRKICTWKIPYEKG